MYVTLRGTPEPTQDERVVADEAAPDAVRPERRSGRVPATVVALGAVSLLTDVSSESVAAILPLYITAVLGMGPLAYGFLDGIHQGISAAVRILGGWWADSTQRPKWVAFVGYLASALSRVAMLPATGFAAITGVVAADRLGKGLRTGPRDALIAASSHPDQLGRNFGVHRAMDTTGALIGPLVAFAVLAAVPIGLGGFRAVFVFSAAFAVIGLAVLVIAVPDLRGRARPDASTARSAATTGPARGASPNRSRLARPRLADLAVPGVRRLLLAAGLLGLVTVGDGFIYLALSEQGSVAARYFPLLFVGTNAAYLLLAVPLGRLADRVGRGKVFVVGHLLLLGVYLITAAGLGGLAITILVLALLGTFYASTDGVLAALASRSVPTASRASGIAAAQTVVALTRFGSSIAFGLLWQLFGAQTALHVMAASLAVAVPVAAWLLLRSRREVVV